MTTEISKPFDYGDLTEPEQRAMERHAAKVIEIRGRVARCAIETGKELKEAHERLARGRTGTFGVWVEKRLGISDRHARNFIAAYETFGGFAEHVFRVFDDSALFVLAAPSCPEPARKEALKLAEAGKPVTHRLASAIVEKHKPQEGGGSSGYSAHGTGKKKGGKKKTAAEGASAGRVENPVPGDAGQDTDGQGAGVSPAPAADSPPPPSTNGQVPQTPAPARPSPAPAPPPAAPVTASDLLPRVASLHADCRKVGEAINGEPFDKAQATRACDLLTYILSGDPPVYRLVRMTGKPTTAEQCEAIYEAYPRKVGKAEALKAIEKALKKVEFPKLLEAVSEYARSRHGKDEQFTPHPATWFNQGRWDDDRKEWFRPDSGGRSKAAYKPGPGERFDPNHTGTF